MKSINSFLARIKYQGKLNIDLESLTKLQTCFLKNVPFENLDVINGVALDYSSKNVFNKIVIQNRGGLCYECNGLFHDMLEELGFDVHFIIGAMFPDKVDKFDFSHMALIVTINEKKYLVDVGNGKSFGNPLSIQTVSTSQSEATLSTVKPYNSEYYGLFYFVEEKWEARYIFNIDKKTRADFKKSCHFVESSPNSEFTKKVLVSMLFDTQRITLSGNTLIATIFEEKSVKRNLPKDEYTRVLKDTFNIETIF